MASQIVKIAPSPVGTLHVYVGKRLVTTVGNIGAAKRFLVKKYGKKFEQYSKSSGFDGASIIGQKNPRMYGPLYFVLTYTEKSNYPSLVTTTLDLDYANKMVELINGKGGRAGIRAQVSTEFPSNYEKYDLVKRSSGWFSPRKPKHGSITALQKEIDANNSRVNPIKKRKPAKRRNIAMGITQGTGKTRRFFPIRASADYDPTLLSGFEGKRARSEKRSAAKKRSGLKAKGKKAIKTKSTVKTKLATKRRKAKKAVGLFGARALKKALPTSRRNPKAKRFLFFESKTGGYGVDRNVFTAYAGTLKLAEKQFAKAFPSIYVKGNWHVEEAPFISSKRSNPKSSRGKRPIPAAFRAQAQRAKAMTPAQRAAWAKKMQAARKAKARLKNR